MRNDVMDNTERNPKYEMDFSIVCSANNSGHNRMLYYGEYCTPYRVGIIPHY
jgi:hypothetical protein